MLPTTAQAAIGTPALDGIVHIIQAALAPAFLLSALATLLNVFSTRLARVADRVDALSAGLAKAGPDEAGGIRLLLAHFRRRSLILDGAVVLASLAGMMTVAAVLTLFIGALGETSTAALLFGWFGLALVFTIAALLAFMMEILLAGRGIRLEVSKARERQEAG